MYAVFEQNRFTGLVNSNQHIPLNALAIPISKEVYADLIGNVRKQRKLKLSYDATGKCTLVLPDAAPLLQSTTKCNLIIDTSSSKDTFVSIDVGAGLVVDSDDPRSIIVALGPNPAILTAELAQIVADSLIAKRYTLLNSNTLTPIEVVEVLHTTNNLPTCVTFTHIEGDGVTHVPFAGAIVYDVDYPLFGCAWVTAKQRVPPSALHMLTSSEVTVLLNGVTPVEYTTKNTNILASGTTLLVEIVKNSATIHRKIVGVVVYDVDYPIVGLQWISDQDQLTTTSCKTVLSRQSVFLESGLIPTNLELKNEPEYS